MDSDEALLNDYVRPADVPAVADPYAIGARCLQMPEHEHLLKGEPPIAYLFKSVTKIKHMRRTLGTAYMPRVTGQLASLFDHMLGLYLGATPVFLIVLDLPYWLQADARQREVLVFHELCHCVQQVDEYGTPKFSRETGEPLWEIAPHNIEEFHSVVRRYGAHGPDVENFMAAYVEGEVERGEAR